MSVYEIHFMMLVLGILAGLFVAGRFRRAAKRRNPYKKTSNLVPIGWITMLVVALSPLSRFIPSLPFELPLLTQSFLFSALGLFIIMFLDSIIKSFKTRDEKPHYRAGAGQVDTSAVQRQSYTDSTAPTQATHDAVTVDKSSTNSVESESNGFKVNSTVDESAVGDAVQTELFEKISTANQETKTVQDSIAEANADLTNEAASIEVTDPLENLDAKFEGTTDLNQKIDLSDQADEMNNIRDQLSEEVVLPSSNSWQETQTEIDLTQDVMPKDDKLASVTDKAIEATVIEDAEVVAEQSVNEFRNDITGDYDSPAHSASAQNLTADEYSGADDLDVDMLPIPETLDDALKVSKETSATLQNKIESLEANLQELSALQTSTAESAESRSQKMLEHKRALVQSQEETQAAAESVIEVQTALLKRARKQNELVALKLEKERKELAEQRVEILRTRAVAQKAALLARKASLAQQATRDIAKREQSARMASQEKARKAVLIARNAISALAEEERKRGLTRH